MRCLSKFQRTRLILPKTYKPSPLNIRMYILGLNIGHNATAALLKDGSITACVSEERFSRIKNHAGVPHKSIAYVLKEEGISLKDLDLIVLDDQYFIESDPKFGKRFLEAYTKKPFTKRVLSKIGYTFP